MNLTTKKLKYRIAKLMANKTEKKLLKKLII